MQVVTHGNNARQSGVDALRFIGAVVVVGLHVGGFAEWPYILSGLSRSAGRWAIPFYFVTMGFFVGASSNVMNASAKAAARLLRILFVFTLIYLTVWVLQDGFRAIVDHIFNPNFFVAGVWYHLWFLHSSILGLLLLVVGAKLMAHKYALSILILALLSFSILDAIAVARHLAPEISHSNRFIFGVFALWLGVALGSRSSQLSRGIWQVMFCTGFLLLAVQCALVEWRGGVAGDLQLPIGGLLIGASAFQIGLTSASNRFLDGLANLGRRYSLGLYLIHPLIIEILRALKWHRSDVLWLGAVIIAITLLIALERWLPAVKGVLDGDPFGKVKAVRHWI